MSKPDDDFLRRWSARKLKARDQPDLAPDPAPAREPDPTPAAPDAGAPEPAPPKSEAEVLEELGLPDPDILVKGDDFRAFLAAGVPAALRARALRRLWISDPVLANLDGLNDYDGDFTDKATVRPGLKTAYRVGKGYLRQPAQPVVHAEAPGPEALSGAPEADEAVAGEAADPAPVVPPSGAGDGGSALDPALTAEAKTAQDGAARDGGVREEPDEAAGEGAREEGARETAASVRSRRMRFHFDAG